MGMDVATVEKRLLDSLEKRKNGYHDPHKQFGAFESQDDAASVEEPIAVDAEIRELNAGRVGQTLQALAALQRGEYGVCIDCSKRIPQTRLETLPDAVRCVKCQRLDEGENM